MQQAPEFNRSGAFYLERKCAGTESPIFLEMKIHRLIIYKDLRLVPNSLTFEIERDEQPLSE